MPANDRQKVIQIASSYTTLSATFIIKQALSIIRPLKIFRNRRISVIRDEPIKALYIGTLLNVDSPMLPCFDSGIKCGHKILIIDTLPD